MQSSDLLERLNAKSVNNVKRVNPWLKKFLVTLINGAGSLFFLFRKTSIPANPKKILFISLYFNGDVLFQSPVFELTRRLYPDAEMHIWAKNRVKGVIEGYPYFKKVHYFDDIKSSKSEFNARSSFRDKIKFFKKLKQEKYDIIFDLTGMAGTAFAVFYAKPKYSAGLNFQGCGFVYNHESDAIFNGHLIDKYLNVLTSSSLVNNFDAHDHLKKPVIYIGPKIVSKVNEILSSLNVQSKYIVIHTTAGWEGKSWDKEKFVELIKSIPLSYVVLIIGGKEDLSNADFITKNTGSRTISLAGKISLIESAEIIKRASLFIGADSGPLYLAEAVGTPFICLFGPTNPLFSAPRDVKNTVIYKELFCSADKDEQYCKLMGGLNCRTHDCMHLITAEEVSVAIGSILRDS